MTAMSDEAEEVGTVPKIKLEPKEYVHQRVIKTTSVNNNNSKLNNRLTLASELKLECEDHSYDNAKNLLMVRTIDHRNEDGTNHRQRKSNETKSSIPQSNCVTSSQHNEVRQTEHKASLHTTDSYPNSSICNQYGQTSCSCAPCTNDIRHEGHPGNGACSLCRKQSGQCTSLPTRNDSHVNDVVFTCSVCAKIFPTEEKLTLHSILHTDASNTCHNCHKKFSNSGNLTKHIRRVHLAVKRYKCSVCEKLFMERSSLERHSKVHRSVRKCGKCGKVFPRQSSLINHQRACSGENMQVFKESVSSKSAMPKTDIRLNLGDDVSGQVKSTSDKAVSTSDQDIPNQKILTELKDEENALANEKQFRCEVCGREYHKFYLLIRHMKRHKISSAEKTSYADKAPSKEKQSTDNVLCGNDPSIEQAGDHQSTLGSDSETDKALINCDICKKVFSSKSNLGKHRKIHLGLKPHGCDSCGKMFREKCDLQRHMRSHTGEKPFRCDHCGKWYTDRMGLKAHLDRAHSSEAELKSLPECEVSGKEVVLSSFSLAHRETRVDAKFKCKTCGKIFSTKSNLSKHEKSHSVVRERGCHDYGCHDCGKTFTKSAELKTHVNIPSSSSSESKLGSNGQKYSCDVCSKEFANKLSLTSHGRVHGHDKLYSCHLCKKSFTRHSTLEQHKEQHVSPKSLVLKRKTGQRLNVRGNICQFCGKAFNGKSGLEKHLTKGCNKQKYSCKVCLKVFAHKLGLASHQRVHVKDKLFSCGICDKIFTKESTLKQHRDIHSSTKNHVCEICGKGFLSQYILTNHIKKVHSDRCVCDICGKGFATVLEYLGMHRQMHTGETPFKCNECGKTFVSGSNLLKHEKRHSGVKAFTHGAELKRHMKIHLKTEEPVCLPTSTGNSSKVKQCACQFCKKTFIRSSDLNRHLKMGCNKQRYACTLCSEVFGNKLSLASHQRVHVASKQYSCGICGKSYTRKFTLQQHMAIHTSKENHACGICGKIFLTQRQLATHMRMVHTDRYLCDVCGKWFSSESYLLMHKLMHKGETPFKCNECEKVFVSKYNLTKHIKRHGKGYDYMCYKCGKQFKEKWYMEQHQAVHAKQKPYACNICSKQFTMQSYLNTHLRRHAAQPRQPIHKCDLCEKKFTTRAYLNLHRHHHTSERQHVCTICGKRSITKSVLKVHMKSHEQKPEFPCDSCDAIFTTELLLSRHHGKHHQTYVCAICERVMSSALTLAVHTRIHLGERPYQCEVCKKGFPSKAGLESHMHVHSATTYPCDVCGRKLSTFGNLRKHKRKNCGKKSRKPSFGETSLRRSPRK